MTDNHNYDTPTKGSSNWHVPLNSNFERLDADVEIRDVEGNLDSYTPTDGSKFLATDTGNVYLGDGSTWDLAPVQPHAHDDLHVRSKLRLPVKSADPDSASEGDVWYRSDTGVVRVQTPDGPVTLTGQTSSGDGGDGGDGGSTDAYATMRFDDDSYTNQFTRVDDWNGGNRAIDSAGGRDALRVDVDEGGHWGTILRYGMADAGHSEPEELYARYYVYFPSDFQGEEGGGKLPGFAAPYGDGNAAGGNPVDGTDGWSARGGWREIGGQIDLEYYAYHADMSGTYGDRWAWDASIQKGEWHQIDQYVKVNTPGQRDGILRGWVNGQQAFDKTNFYVRNEGYDNIKVQSYWLTFYYGGSWSSPTNNSVYFDDLTLSPTPLS